ncbi:type II toxin-antitoxin system Phd/YefM family antitoxin [Zavarzinella formosa]|uniref:type II toxin-antitoxin system Phd/YefM family antitoxin n=1 Tax=Zavarzinella formosa TaxID=360055 RepID=UPI0002EC6457|nr:hypothetical protein [Zavarzinella formosa]
MTTLTIDQAQSQLSLLIEQLQPGDELVITRDDLPVAKLVKPTPEKPIPIFGSCKGMLTILSDDEDHLKDFTEYMP